MRLKSDSEIRLARVSARALPGGTQYELSKGKAFTYYRKHKGVKKTFAVETPEATATVLGTDFMVTVMPEMNRTYVGVLDGVVRVTGRQLLRPERLEARSVFVEAGEKTTVRLGQLPTEPKRLMEDELMEMEELYGLGTKPQVALLISTGKGRVRELLSVTPLYINTEKPARISKEIEAIAKTFNQAIKAGAKDKIKDNIRQFEDIVKSYPNPKYDVQFLLFIGAYYEYINEHGKAIETFQRVVDKYPKSTLASIAQCAIGIIYEEKLNDLEKAKNAYQAVLSNYPKSAEVQEAQEGLKRIAAQSMTVPGQSS
jgi:TolA-binding protein